MEKYSYGPLIYNTVDDDDDSGNFYWSGFPPVAYDSDGIPIDKNGNQCLPLECPLHPGYKPKEFVFSEILQDKLPSLEEYKEWFKENFLEATDRQIYRYILKWYVFNREDVDKPLQFFELQKKINSIDEMVGQVWQLDAPIS